MDWNPNYRYKILGKLIRSGNEILFIFDLTSPEIFPRTLKDNGTVTTARTPSYPEEWKNQFGIPVEEHQKSMQVNIFEGYAVFDIQEKKKATDKSIEKAKEPSTAESEENPMNNKHSSHPLICIDFKRIVYESTAIHSVKLVTQNIFNFLLILIKNDRYKG